MRVDNIQAADTITERGERVYSPNNKPSASDVGALPANGKAVSASRADQLGGTNLNQTATSYVTITNPTWYGDSPTGKTQMVKPDSEGLPTRENGGYLIKLAARDVGKGHAWMYISDYTGRAHRVFIGADERGTEAPNWTELYSQNHKPTAEEVGARPSNWVPSWNDVQSKPASATRWPNWGEVTGKPSTMPPSSHTHPWSQITGQPVQTQRWPSWDEVTGKPGNLLDQATADTRYLGKNAQASDAAKLGGKASAYNETKDTIVLRDGSGDITTRLFKSTYSSQDIPPKDGAAICFRNNNTDDRFLRFVTKVGLVTWLGTALADAVKAVINSIGIYSKSESDNKFAQYNYADSASYATLVPPKSTWLRSPTSGFLPYSNGNSSLGTPTWKWKEIHGNLIYEAGQRVYSPNNKPSATDIGAEPALPIDKKRKITYGTAEPTGGEDGDIYIQYKD